MTVYCNNPEVSKLLGLKYEEARCESNPVKSR